jgi:hypothetical protein
MQKERDLDYIRMRLEVCNFYPFKPKGGEPRELPDNFA